MLLSAAHFEPTFEKLKSSPGQGLFVAHEDGHVWLGNFKLSNYLLGA